MGEVLGRQEMGEILECLEDLNLMSRRQGSTWHEGATLTENNDGVGQAQGRSAQQPAISYSDS